MCLKYWKSKHKEHIINKSDFESRVDLQQAMRRGDYEIASKLQYHDIPELEKKLDAAEREVASTNLTMVSIELYYSHYDFQAWICLPYSKRAVFFVVFDGLDMYHRFSILIEISAVINYFDKPPPPFFADLTHHTRAKNTMIVSLVKLWQLVTLLRYTLQQKFAQNIAGLIHLTNPFHVSGAIHYTSF